MNVLITGGCGFIGSHLAERFLERGDSVMVLDDLSTGSMDNIAHLIGRPGFQHRIGSALDRPLVSELVDRADVTAHLAAAVGVRLIVEQPVHTIETNVGATEMVLTAAAKKQKLVVLASTSEVYGKSTLVPFREDHDLQLGPTSHSRWAYACSKALDEWLALAYSREKHVPVIIARFFNTVGPRQTGRYGMVLPGFARQALRGEPITPDMFVSTKAYARWRKRYGRDGVVVAEPAPKPPKAKRLRFTSLRRTPKAEQPDEPYTETVPDWDSPEPEDVELAEAEALANLDRLRALPEPGDE